MRITKWHDKGAYTPYWCKGKCHRFKYRLIGNDSYGNYVFWLRGDFFFFLRIFSCSFPRFKKEKLWNFLVWPCRMVELDSILPCVLLLNLCLQLWSLKPVQIHSKSSVVPVYSETMIFLPFHYSCWWFEQSWRMWIRFYSLCKCSGPAMNAKTPKFLL